MQMMMQGGVKGKFEGKSAGKGKTAAKRTPTELNPAGSGRVFVRGFDFGTTDEQLEEHCGKVGKIVAVFWKTKGSATIVYKTKKQAEKAVEQLNGTTIEGNSRYMDVLPRPSD